MSRTVSKWRPYMEAIVIVAGCSHLGWGAQATEPLPDLPRIEFTDFSPPVRRQFERAVEEVSRRPLEAGANGRLGMLLHAYERYEPAAACYERTQRLEPQAFQWLYYLGIVHAELGRYEAAASWFGKALEQKAGYLPARLGLAEALLAAHRLAEAARICESLLSEHPDIALVQFYAGRVRALWGDLPAAAAHYEKACRFSKSFGAARYQLALVYRDLGEREKARRQMTLYEKEKLAWPAVEDPLLEAVKEMNSSALYQLRRAVSLEASGQVEASAAAHERALEIDPQLDQAHVNLITLYGKKGDVEKAEKHYRAALAINPNLAEAHYNFGVLMAGEGRSQQATEAFERALEINPFYPDAHNNLGYMRLEQGKLEEAERHFRAALENRPNYPLAHFHLGRLLLHGGRTGEAIQHLLSTLEGPEDESTPAFLYALGAAYARSGNYQEALGYLHKARQKAESYGQVDLLKSIQRDLKLLQESKSQIQSRFWPAQGHGTATEKVDPRAL